MSSTAQRPGTPDRAWRRVTKRKQALAVASPEEARRILRKNTRTVLRTILTSRQALRQVHDAHAARTGVCTCATGEPNPFRPGWHLDLCRSMTRANASIAEGLRALELLGPPEPGEDKSRWRLRGG